MEAYKDKRAKKDSHYVSCLNGLAEVYRLTGDYAQAKQFFRQVLEIRKVTPGENHPDYASALNNMGLLYTSMDEYSKAEPVFRG